ncbi:HAMP domain-containing histidine kinase [Pedobacter frigiditerrae]|uniref:histidine kinase n=1 Tax=Pedobacter frigiditerrae TaxID=2530452 RepID=A0A4R0MLB5_9SPHI|nr:HAMP domain-containing sensor histidine kinase [Pedobacter frigiditerrae]TCC87333.1 HAMP domain-containing histidine kinase [Pedobacter frigiditerrae]
MKLSTKLTLFITGSKLAIVLLFIITLPFLVEQIASQFTNYTLKQQRKEVLKNINKNGIAYYLQGDESYGSYTMLKEEFVALLPVNKDLKADTIKDAQRIIENDTLSYRILSETFKFQNKNYLLEIGKTSASINQYNKQLQQFASYVLVILILLSIIIDLTFIRMVIKPLSKIIKTRLINRKFPFKLDEHPVKTSTTDFKYLDESLALLMTQINEAFYKEREFTSNASHEIMTPISILQHKMENLLAEEDLTESAALAIIEMMKTLNRLKKISNSLLLIARIENQQYQDKEDVKPLDLFNLIIEEISHRLEEKNLNIQLKINKDMVLREINKDLLYQLFFNLVHNAIKFNREGGNISISDNFTAKGEYEISVSDTGTGISTEQLPHIFDRFIKSNATENYGYGLGLTIVKSIADYHHLNIQVESELNEGTKFKVFFLNWKSTKQ